MIAPVGEGQLGSSLASGFLTHGHEVILVGERRLTGGYGLYVRARRMRADRPLAHLAGRQLVERVARHVPDVVVVVKGRFLTAGTVRRLREKTGAVLINWCPDDPLYPPFRENEWLRSLREFDLVAIWSELLSHRLLEADINAVAVPFGYDPVWYDNEPAEPLLWEVVFVGQWSAEREAHIRGLAGLSLGVAGSGWAKALRGTRFARSVIPGRHFGRQAATLYRSAKVGLNILHPQNAGTHNMRSWELPATETAMVATDTREHRTMFENGGAVLVDSPDATRAAVNDLLVDAQRRREVAHRGRAAVAEGTYAERVAALLRELQARSV